MSLPAVLAPLFVQVVLTFGLLVCLAYQRVTLVRTGAVKRKDIALREPNWPPRTMQIQNAVSNQLEVPVLFYVLTILSLVTRHADHAILHGITRTVVLDAVKEQNIAVEQRAFMLDEAYKARNEALAAKGIAVITVPENRWGRVDIKTVGLLPNVLARQAAIDQGARDALFVDKAGFVTEDSPSGAVRGVAASAQAEVRDWLDQCSARDASTAEERRARLPPMI